ncbi:polypeptide N-acetylgalactosaminyltransferase 13 [Trichonephila clavipes]|nr:polypeptide N-acetylgalactosaminyltransferase 13 [Trichonephila clavipes]
MLGRRIAAYQPPPTCLPKLGRALLDEWCNIPQDQIGNLILSIPRRYQGPRNSSWQGARSTPAIGLGLEHHTDDSKNYLDGIPRRDDRLQHHLSPPPKFRHGTEGEENILQSHALVIQPTRLRTH